MNLTALKSLQKSRREGQRGSQSLCGQPKLTGPRASLLVLWPLVFLAAALMQSLIPGVILAQEHKPKVPGLDKITSGSQQQAFSGIVKSLDVKHSILNVNTVEGDVTEIFPVKKTVHVSTAEGDNIKLTDLTPGTNVLIYYEQKGDRRTVKQILVLAAEPNPKKKPSPPS